MSATQAVIRTEERERDRERGGGGRERERESESNGPFRLTECPRLGHIQPFVG